jgi:hypothetical protein
MSDRDRFYYGPGEIFDQIEATAEVARRGHELLDRNEGDPANWPDDEKLRLIALHFDAMELDLPSPLDPTGTEVQRDLRRIADSLQALSDTPAVDAARLSIKDRLGLFISRGAMSNAIKAAIQVAEEEEEID